MILIWWSSPRRAPESNSLWYCSKGVVDGRGSLIGCKTAECFWCSGGYESSAREELSALPCGERVESGACWVGTSRRRVLYREQAVRTVRAGRIEVRVIVTG